MNPAAILEKLVMEHLPAVEMPADSIAFAPTGRAAARLRARLADEATDDPEAIREAQESLDEMKRAMNRDREQSGAELIF